MWNEERYINKKRMVSFDLDNKRKKPFDFMMEYKACILVEDYEHAKAITEVLKPLNYETLDTHQHIKILNK